ncbi:hypothetical protein B0H10DRAFT_2053097 [Mycena sp. CBHHK59/15]|nr:hypothetical protein B0H10DRAFT_2053097 [Mycena sp. CBHHK59/15]
MWSPLVGINVAVLLRVLCFVPMENTTTSSLPATSLAHISSAILLQKVKYMNVVSITILVFDYLLALELEVSLVWGSKWSLSRILFACARYPPFIDVPLVLWYSLTPNINIHDCLPIYSASSWGTFFGIAMAEAILLLRTHALMGRKPLVLILLGLQYVIIAGTTVVVLTLFLKSLKFGPPPLPSVVGCHAVDGSIILVVAFILVLFNETVLMVCTLWVGITSFRHSHNLFIKTLYRDGITYFIFLFVLSAGNLGVLIWGPVELVDLFNTFLRVMHSVLSTRVILHVREAGRKRLTSTIDSLADPRFRIPGTTIECNLD